MRGFYTEFWVSTATSYSENFDLICVGNALLFLGNAKPCVINKAVVMGIKNMLLFNQISIL